MNRGGVALLVFAVLLVSLGVACDGEQTPESTPGPTETPVPTAAPTPTMAPEPEPTISPTATAQTTATPGATVRPTHTPGPTVNPRVTAEATATPEPTVALTVTPEPTVALTATPEPTVALTVTPEPTVALTATSGATATPLASPTPAPTNGDTPSSLTIDADTTWQEVFDNSPVSVQVCINKALGGSLSTVMEKRIVASNWADDLYPCLDREVGSEIFLINFMAEIGDEGLGLNDDEASCVLELAAEIDLATAAIGDWYTVGELFAVVFSCAPDPFINSLVEGLGVEEGALSEKEIACIRGQLANYDLAGYLAGSPNERGEIYSLVFTCAPGSMAAAVVRNLGIDIWEFSSAEESCFQKRVPATGWTGLLSATMVQIGEIFSVLLFCAPEQVASQLISGMDPGFDLGFSPYDVSEETASCFREQTANVEWGRMFAWNSNGYALGEFVKGLFLCAPEILIKRTAEGYGLVESDIGDKEVACLREWGDSFDWTRFVIENPQALEQFESGTRRCLQEDQGARSRDNGG